MNPVLRFKWLFFILLLLLLTLTAGAQKSPDPAADYYLNKSKNQKKAAWILAGSGTALLITSFVIPRGDEKGYSAASLFTEKEYENDGIRAVIATLGIACAGISIPLFIASGKNKRRAENISLHMRSSEMGIPLVKGFSPPRHPELLIRIKF